MLRATSEFDLPGLTELIGLVYEAAFDATHWPAFVDAVERIHRDSRVTLFKHENGRPALAVYKNFASEDLHAYRDHFITVSPFFSRGLTAPTGKAFRYETLVDYPELFRTEYYNDFMRPRRHGLYATGLIIERDKTSPARGAVLSLADQNNDAGRRERQLRLLTVLAPHLTRAFRLACAREARTATADATQAALDGWAHAALVLDCEGRLVAMNVAADTLLRRGDGVRLGRGGHLRAVDEERTQALAAAVRQCAALSSAIDAQARAPDLDGIVLPRPSGRTPLRVMLAPLPFLGGSDQGRGRVLLAIIDGEQIPRTPIAWLARQFGLTPAEQRLAEAIVNGVPLADAADRLGITQHTARNRLKVIQTKTDCHRQVDLVRLALSLPALGST